MKHFVRYIILFLMIATVTGCYDEFMKEEIIGEGKASISATLDFKPMSSALSRTRAAGDALKDISSLHVLLYDKDKNLKNKWKIEGYSESDENRTDKDAEANPNGEHHTAETTTKRATFKLPEEIDFGKYYMYAVANIPDLLTNTSYDDAIKTVDGLKNIPLTWNSEEVANNGQMIGFFTKSSVPALSADDESLVVNEKSVKLHAWLRRAASKVTIAYDGTNLNDNVSIYIMAASIKDIPKSCPLGTENTPDHIDSLIHDGGIIKYFEGDVQPGLDNFITQYKAVVTNHAPTLTYGNHGETAESLFFYENRQGAGENMPDKRQDANGDGQLDYPGLPGDDTYRLKDDVPYGSYIEVDAIYRSENPGKPGVGIIKYRFMLGQNVEKDYNATRNCHYKLTLKFKGYGNDVDWHIEYKQQVLEVTEPKVMN